jgi:hypothetical protein
VDSELAVLADQVSPYVTAAVAAYGGAVLAKANDQAADATVRLGRQMLQRIFGKKAAREVPQPVADLADDPVDPSLRVALRAAIRKAFTEDEGLVGDLRSMLPGAAAVTVTASGERSIAAHTITGVASAGDDATIAR